MEKGVTRRVMIAGILPTACGLANPSRSVASIDALIDMRISAQDDGTLVEVSDSLRGGRFSWHAASVAPDDGGAVFASRWSREGRWIRQTEAGRFDASWYGATPDARAETNNAAFRAASAAVSRGGGVLFVRPGRYFVGEQRLTGTRGHGAAYATAPVIQIDAARGPVTLSGRGVTLKCASGLRYGQFDPVSGRASDTANLDPDFRALPYPYMIDVRNCAHPVRVEGFELDGSLSDHLLGGNWGDHGRQIQATGIYSFSNTGGVDIVDVWSHHHALDGVTVEHAGVGWDSPPYPVRLERVRCEYNGRQGLSWVGGSSLVALRCQFSHTGRGGVRSSPSAGVDMEPERAVCRRGRFVECQFVDNAGAGFLAGGGEGGDVLFERCLFVANSYYALWPKLPSIQFVDCRIVGTLTNPYSSEDPALATRFVRCRFENERGADGAARFSGLLADIGGGATNVLFDRCKFEATVTNGALPWSPTDTRYHECTFTQRGSATSYTRGLFSGVNRFQTAGRNDFSGSIFRGAVYVNGHRQDA